MTEQPPSTLICSKCDDAVDRCEFCEEADCSAVVCYECMNLALGQIVRQPHEHGG